jgi:hypothetical protein
VEEGPGVEAFERELAVAQGIGLTVRQNESLETEQEEHTFEVPVAAGECVSFVASAWGWVAVEAVHLEEAGEQLSLHTPEGMVGHTQYCAPAATVLQAHVDIDHQDGVMGRAAYSGGTLRYAILVGRPPEGLSSLNRGTLTPEARNRVAPTEVLRRAERLAQGKTQWGPPLEIASYRARLVPETAETYQHLRELAQNQDPREMTPHLDLLPETAPPAWRPLAAGEGVYPLPAGDSGPASAPAMAFEGRTAVRLLAVVDATALGRCVEVQLVRNVWDSETSARRLVVGGAPTSSASREGNVMSERVCEGRATYVTEGSDQSPYLLRVYIDAAE